MVAMLNPETEVTTERLKHLASLSASSELQRLLARAEAELESERAAAASGNWRPLWDASGQPKVAYLERAVVYARERLAEGEQRDVIAATRPEGCFCLGTAEPKLNALTDWKKVWCDCPESREAKAALDAAEERELRERFNAAVENAWYEADIPLRFTGFTSWKESPLRNTTAWKLLSAKHEPGDEAWDASWYLYGPYGRGKTGLATCYGAHFLRRYSDTRPPSILFRRVPDLLTELRSTYGGHTSEHTEAELLDRYTSVGLLILDDLGAEQITGSGWVEDKLFQVIGARHDELMPVAFTSNLSLDEIAARIGERLTWRIAEMCGPGHILRIDGENLRDWSKA